MQKRAKIASSTSASTVSPVTRPSRGAPPRASTAASSGGSPAASSGPRAQRSAPRRALAMPLATTGRPLRRRRRARRAIAAPEPSMPSPRQRRGLNHARVAREGRAARGQIALVPRDQPGRRDRPQARARRRQPTARRPPAPPGRAPRRRAPARARAHAPRAARRVVALAGGVDQRTAHAGELDLASTASRVVPGSASTSARSSPERAR